MKLASELKGRDSAIAHCPARSTCPMGALCGIETRKGQPALFPTIDEVEEGQLVWIDVRHEKRAVIIRSGAFSFLSSPEQRDDLAASLFGRGDSLGFAELYLPGKLADTYYIRALTSGQVCSFASKPLRRHLEELPTPQREKILSCLLVNTTSAMYAQVEMLSKSRVVDRITILLTRINELLAREGRSMDELHLTHADIAGLIAADRVSVTRALCKMKEDNRVLSSRRSIVLTDMPSIEDSQYDYCRNFYSPEEGEEMLAGNHP